MLNSDSNLNNETTWIPNGSDTCNKNKIEDNYVPDVERKLEIRNSRDTTRRKDIAICSDVSIFTRQVYSLTHRLPEITVSSRELELREI